MKKFFSAIFSSIGSVSVNGQEYTGSCISINSGNVVIVDGVVMGGEVVPPIHVSINGDVESIDGVATDVSVNGCVDTIKTVSGDVHCGMVTGDVETMSGDVTCGSVAGKVKTMSGDIKMRN